MSQSSLTLPFPSMQLACFTLSNDTWIVQAEALGPWRHARDFQRAQRRADWKKDIRKLVGTVHECHGLPGNST